MVLILVFCWYAQEYWPMTSFCFNASSWTNGTLFNIKHQGKDISVKWDWKGFSLSTVFIKFQNVCCSMFFTCLTNPQRHPLCPGPFCIQFCCYWCSDYISMLIQSPNLLFLWLRFISHMFLEMFPLVVQIKIKYNLTSSCQLECLYQTQKRYKWCLGCRGQKRNLWILRR